ncbi:DNA-entry nuclease [Brevibacillus sp. IT-7CA2]|uniref:DNA-entry nuclease n=1 Tax=Brevibacillus sp. IT-7CA2 TaxID=3026436 RepID=UPI0039E1CDA4
MILISIAGLQVEVLDFDNLGRMKFHPDYHDNHGKRFDEEELCYLAKFYKHDGRRAMSMALGRPELTVQKKYLELQKAGRLPYYKNLDYYV